MNDFFTNIIFTFPTWENEVWEYIQAKRIDKISENFETLLLDLPDDAWKTIYWKGIIIGIPTIRGSVSENDWQALILPELIRGILRAADRNNIEKCYRSLDNFTRNKFHELIFISISGKDEVEKMEWLKKNKPSLYEFYISEIFKSLSVKSVRKSPQTTVTPSSRPTTDNQPLIIHEEKIEPRESVRKSSILSSLPFKFLSRGFERKQAPEGVKVRVETPSESERVVHYNEFSTPLSAFKDSTDIVHLDEFSPKETKTTVPAQNDGVVKLSEFMSSKKNDNKQ